MHMKLGLVWLAACLGALMSGAALADERVALVVGNADYSHAPVLVNPRNDAQDIAASLRRLGFHVTAGFDLDYATMKSRVTEFSRRAHGAEVALFFFAGHGMQVDGVNYLVPTDARLGAKSTVDSEAWELGRILRGMGRGTNLVFLDACRDNPFGRGWAGDGKRSVGRGLAPVERSIDGTFIAYATAEGDIALDGAGRNSPFTEALKQYIEEPGLTIGQVMTRVSGKLAPLAQDPWIMSSLKSDFYFKPPLPSDLGTTTPQPRVRMDPAEAAWRQIETTNNVRILERFLQEFPGSPFRLAAEARIAALRGGTRDPAPSIPLSGEPFTVRTGPGTARVQIMNIEPTYQPGIQLPPGSYDVKVTAPGFDTVERTLRHENEPTDVWIGLPFRDCPVCPKMVEIPTGSYRMGTSEQGEGNTKIEGPVHDVAIRYRLAVGVFEVSFEEWDSCKRDGGCQVPLQDEGSGGAYPIDHATMGHAREYTKWLEDRTGRPYRLPSEAEWEYAARAGTQSERYWGQRDQCAYANGADLVAQLDHADLEVFANCRDGYTRTAPSDDRRFAPNAWGLYHMLGNVHEWTQDCWVPNYLDAPADGRPREDCEEGGAHRVVRGGSWRSAPRWIRACKRHAVDPGASYNDLGFRVVVEVSR